MTRLAVITTHPIQYYAPLFRLLAQRGNVHLKVFYTWEQSGNGAKYDPGFGKVIEWDLPLLDGYEYEFLRNIAKTPGSHHFRGINNPEIIVRLKEYQPDKIIVFGWNFISHLRVMRYFKGRIPLYFRGDSTLLDEKPGVKLILRRAWLKWVYRFVDYALYVGYRNKEYFLAHGLKNKQLLFVPHAIDNSRFSVSREWEAKDLRSRFGIQDQDIMILFAGKLEQKKNPLILLNVFSRLNKREVHLLFVGNGILEEKLKNESRKLGLEKSVHFLPFQNQQRMPVIYQACDLFCLPSQGPEETWGLAVNEAMACKKPVIVSDKVGCAEDLVIPGVNGYIFKSGYEDDLLHKIEFVINSRDLAKMGEESFRHIDKFSIMEAVTRLECL